MAAPIIPLVLTGAGAYAVWRGFFYTDKRHRSNAKNAWQNEAFAEREEKRRRIEAKERKGKRK